MPLLLMLFLVLALVTAFDCQGGEPTDLFAGVSAWPRAFMRLAAAVLGVYFMYAVVSRLDGDWHELDHQYFSGNARPSSPDGLPRWKLGGWLTAVTAAGAALLGLVMWLQSELSPLCGVLVGIAVLLVLSTGRLSALGRALGIRSASSLPTHSGYVLRAWREYGACGTPQQRLARVLLVSLPMWSFIWLLLSLFDFPAPPCRGLSCDVYPLLLALSGSLTLLLLLLVLDALGLTVRWVRSLENATKFSWPRAPNSLSAPPVPADSYLRMRLIGERTAEVTRLTYYPVITVLLMLLARTTYFDAWGYPAALQVLVAFALTILLGSAGYLNHVARRVRKSVLDDLRDRQLRLSAEQVEGKPAATRQEIADLIEHLQHLNVGAFQHPWEQPVVRALLMLLSGAVIAYWEVLQLSS